MAGKLSLLAFLALPAFVYGLHNVTVDDSNSMVSYTGDWGGDSSYPSPLDYNGSHTMSKDATATATFTFTGVAVYYLSPLWPYTVNSLLTLDSNPGTVVDLTDHSRPATDGGSETVQSSAVWGVSRLSNAQHKLVVSMVPGGQYVIADGFTYTVLDASDTSSSVSPSGSGTPSSSNGAVAASTVSSSVPTPPRSTKNNTAAIAAGAAVGAVALVLGLLAAIALCRRQRKRRVSGSDNSNTSADVRYDTAAPATERRVAPPPSLQPGIHRPYVPPSTFSDSSTFATAASASPLPNPTSLYDPWSASHFEQSTPSVSERNIFIPPSRYYDEQPVFAPSLASESSRGTSSSAMEKQRLEWERIQRSSVGSGPLYHPGLPYSERAGPMIPQHHGQVTYSPELSTQALVFGERVNLGTMSPVTSVASESPSSQLAHYASLEAQRSIASPPPVYTDRQ